MRYDMVNHGDAHKRKKKGLPVHVGIYDAKTKEYVATAYSTDFAARIVSALNEREVNGPITTEETYHISNILRHYAHAKEKHPYFCDNLNDTIWNTVEPKLLLVKRSLKTMRRRLEIGSHDGNLSWYEVLECEVLEALEAILLDNKPSAIKELYDCTAVCLRTIDVLEGRQKLGKPAEGGDIICPDKQHKPNNQAKGTQP